MLRDFRALSSSQSEIRRFSEAYAIDNAVNFPLTNILSRAREGSLSAKLREKIAPETKLGGYLLHRIHPIR